MKTEAIIIVCSVFELKTKKAHQPQLNKSSFQDIVPHLLCMLIEIGQGFVIGEFVTLRRISQDCNHPYKIAVHR